MSFTIRSERTAVQHDQRSRVKYAALVGMVMAKRSAQSPMDCFAIACAMLETRTIFDPNLPPKRTSAAA